MARSEADVGKRGWHGLVVVVRAADLPVEGLPSLVDLVSSEDVALQSLAPADHPRGRARLRRRRRADPQGGTLDLRAACASLSAGHAAKPEPPCPSNRGASPQGGTASGTSEAQEHG